MPCRAQLGRKVIGLRYWPQVESVPTGTVWRCASGTAAEAALLFDRSADCTDLEQLPLTCAAIARTIPVLQTMYVTLC